MIHRFNIFRKITERRKPQRIRTKKNKYNVNIKIIDKRVINKINDEWINEKVIDIIDYIQINNY